VQQYNWSDQLAHIHRGSTKHYPGLSPHKQGIDSSIGCTLLVSQPWGLSTYIKCGKQEHWLLSSMFPHTSSYLLEHKDGLICGNVMYYAVNTNTPLYSIAVPQSWKSVPTGKRVPTPHFWSLSCIEPKYTWITAHQSRARWCMHLSVHAN